MSLRLNSNFVNLKEIRLMLASGGIKIANKFFLEFLSP